jgi:hypothetical protein
LVSTEHKAGHDSEGACAGYLGNQVRASDEAHARLQNRVINLEEVTESRPKTEAASRHTNLTFCLLKPSTLEMRTGN